MDGHALLFTDLVDSTAVVERLGDARAASVLAEHDRRARALLARHGGREIDHSDGFFLLFDSAPQAAAFALAYHEALATLDLRARAGLHVGTVTLRENAADEVARGAKPVEVEGIAKPLAARVMSLARGGQTLLTAAAQAAIGDALTADRVSIASHGHYRLKGLAEPIEIFELGIRGDSSFAPADDAEKAFRVVRADDDGWRPAREVRHTLPRERDAFVGRAADLAAVAARLDAGARLVTIVGPGGTGKTRLARRYGWNWLGDWPGGVYFCDLSEARTLESVFFVVAVALDVPLGKSDPGVQLGHAIATRGRCLVILDNFEQIVQYAAASVGRWLDRAPDAAFLATSRERLHLGGEDLLPLEPLSLDAEGVELFALRARAQRADFAITATNRASVERIVALLDGLPLAIELAAARIRLLSPAQLLDRLTDRFGVLAGGRGAADRQATLRSAIDWSWNLLLPWEQLALAQCSVFEGGFTLDAAEAVLDLSSWPDAPAVLDAVQVLVDKSLLRTWVPVEQTRHDIEEPYFGMYLSIHDYAAQKLAASGAGAERAVEQRHGSYFARFGADERLRSLFRDGGGARRRALMLELDNLVAACRRAVARQDAPTAVGALRATWEAIATQGPFDVAIGLGAEVDTIAAIEPSLHAAALTSAARANIAAGRLEHAGALLSRALAFAQAASDPGREAEVLTRLANAERQQGRMAEARRSAERALALRSALGEADGVALAELGIVQRQTGAMDEARSTYERALAIDREIGDGDAEAKALNSLAIVHAEQGRFDLARDHFEAALAVSRELDDRRQEGLVLGNLGTLNIEQGRHTLGREQCEAALAIHRDAGDRTEEGNVLANLATLDLGEGRIDEARARLTAALAIAREAGNRRTQGVVLGMLGALEREQGRSEPARTHFEQALILDRAVGNRRYEGMALAGLGDLMTQQGRLDEAGALLTQAEAQLRAVDEKLELVALLCGRGRLELAAGERSRAETSLAEADHGARSLQLDPESKLWDEIAALRAAIAAGRPTAR
ncbi:MAG TPA: tetratricopeptide repeat protein [Caldimonas sp.]|jgi:predicted ATPase/class 3 adenylate cyclase/Tfp pilus assembly protein PilF